MLTLGRCSSLILHVLNKQGLDPALSGLEIVNDAGHKLANARAWTWMQRRGQLNTVAAQEYIDMTPLTGYRGMVAAAWQNTWLAEADYAAIQQWRSSSGTGAATIPTYYAVLPNTTAAGVVSYRMELYGTPSATDNTGPIKCFYQGGWQPPQSNAEDARIAVPDWCEGLYVMFLRAVAQGFVEYDQGPTEQRIENIKRSSTFMDAVSRDSVTQHNFGQIRGGAVAMQMTTFPTRRMPSSIVFP